MSHDLQTERVTVLSSRPVVLPFENIDTDQIIPARFLTTTSREGLGVNLFHDWRYEDSDINRPKPDFALNDPVMAGRSVLVGGHNFGCGSSREHAPWALTDFGFRAVLSTEIADIFRNNATKNGLVPVQISQGLYSHITAHPDAEITVNLEHQTVRVQDGPTERFEIEAFARYCLMNGLDQMGYLLSQADTITVYEGARA